MGISGLTNRKRGNWVTAVNLDGILVTAEQTAATSLGLTVRADWDNVLTAKKKKKVFFIFLKKFFYLPFHFLAVIYSSKVYLVKGIFLKFKI